MSVTVKPDLKKWEIVEEKTVYECEPWIRVDVHKIKLPNGKIVDDFHRLIMPEYVVVYPVTSDQEVIMLQAYRHGVGKVHMFSTMGVEKVQEPDSGDLEEVKIKLFDILSLTRSLQDGKIESLSSAAAISLGLKKII